MAKGRRVAGRARTAASLPAAARPSQRTFGTVQEPGQMSCRRSLDEAQRREHDQGGEREEDARFDRLERPEAVGQAGMRRRASAEREEVLLRVDPRTPGVLDRQVLACNEIVRPTASTSELLSTQSCACVFGVSPTAVSCCGSSSARTKEVRDRESRGDESCERDGHRGNDAAEQRSEKTPRASANTAYAGTTAPRPRSGSGSCSLRSGRTAAATITIALKDHGAEQGGGSRQQHLREQPAPAVLPASASRYVPCSSSRASSGAPTKRRSARGGRRDSGRPGRGCHARSGSAGR